MLPKPPHDVPPPSEAWLEDDDDELWWLDVSVDPKWLLDPCEEDERLLDDDEQRVEFWSGAVRPGRSWFAQSSGAIMAYPAPPAAVTPASNSATCDDRFIPASQRH